MIAVAPRPRPVRFRLTRRGVAAIAALLVLVVVAVLGFTPPAQRFLADPAGAEPIVGVRDVQILSDARQNHRFAPSAVQVPVGSEVTWHFAEVDESGAPVLHNVVFEDVASPVQGTGTFSRTFTEPGSYLYACTLHAWMNGRVDVVAQP